MFTWSLTERVARTSRIHTVFRASKRSFFIITKVTVDENGHQHIYMEEAQSDGAELHTEERGAAVRGVQEARPVHGNVQSVPGGNSERNQNRESELQGARAEVTAEPAADRSEEAQREITQEQANSVEPRGTNYVIPESGLKLPNGEKARFKANIAAIKTLRAVMSENRMATPQEQETLSRYVGWGGIANAFSKTNADWAKEYKQLKELLSEKEWSAAFRF